MPNKRSELPTWELLKKSEDAGTLIPLVESTSDHITARPLAPRTPLRTTAPLRSARSSASNQQLFHALRLYCQMAALTPVAMGVCALYGWMFHSVLWASVLPGLVTTKTNTAICLILAGTSLWLLIPGVSRGRRGKVARALAIAVVLIAAATLSEYLFKMDLGIDQILFKDFKVSAGTISPGRPAPTTTTALAFAGLALILLDWKRPLGRFIAQILSLLSGLIAMLAIDGYIYHASVTYRIFMHTQVAIPTAVGLVFLSSGILLARPEDGVVANLTGDGTGSVMARRFLPAIIFMPTFLGWICLQGQWATLYGPELSLSLYAVVNLIVFAGLVWSNARLMNREHGQRSRAESELRKLLVRQSEETLRLLLEGVKDYSILMLDPQGRVTIWNSGAEGIHGYGADEIIGCHFSTVYTPEAVAADQPAHDLKTAVEQGRCEMEGWRVRKNGSRFVASVVITSLRDQAGQLRGFCEVTRDITARKNAESDKRLLTERLSLATSVAKLGVWEWDIASNNLTWDATMFGLYGLSPRVAMTYEGWVATVHPGDRGAFEAFLQKAITRKSQESAEFRICRPDGSTRNISVIQKAFTDDHAMVNRVIGVNLDVTERQAADAAREQSRKDQLQFKDEFLSQVSHELRSPLTAIKQFTTLMLDGLAGELTDEQRQYQEIVLKNTDQLQYMINDLLEVTRLEAGKLSVEPENINVATTVAYVYNTFRETCVAKAVTLLLELPSGLPLAYADPIRLKQILIILVDNAIKFTPEGGTVTIKARRGEIDSSSVLVEVADTGSGIRAEMTEKIFDRLYQVSNATQAGRKGLGLGLFICKELVTRQGGSIWVHSVVGEGSTFSFTMPLFSLKNLIAPLFRNEKWPTESVALLTVETRLPITWSSGESKEPWSREVSRIVQSCLLPNLDVLFPKMEVENEGPRLLVVAFADCKGATVLAERIREQIETRMGLEKKDVSVTFTMLKPPLPYLDASKTEILASMATYLEESIMSSSVAPECFRA